MSTLATTTSPATALADNVASAASDLVQVIGQIQTALNHTWGQVDPPIPERAGSHTGDRATTLA